MRKMGNNKSQKKLKARDIVIGIAIITVMTLSILLINMNSKKPSSAIIKNSDIIIKVSELSDKATFYPVEIDGIKLEVLAVKAPDGTIRTAFNTCQVCYSSGKGYYVQEGNVLVCQNCGNRFAMSDVEVTRGGCNPVPISPEEKTITNETITITNDFLSKAKVIFANWKN